MGKVQTEVAKMAGVFSQKVHITFNNVSRVSTQVHSLGSDPTCLNN